MPLDEIKLTITHHDRIPGDIAAYLREADVRIERFMTAYRAAPPHAFVPSDFATVYYALVALRDSRLVTGDTFCEWGSGFGIVAGLASMLDFNACGIEIHEALVDESEALAEDFGLPAEFACGSFIPHGSQHLADEPEDFATLNAAGTNAYAQLGLDPDDFDIIYAYPWPGGERPIEAVFEKHAANGALLLTYHGIDEVRLRRKTS